MKLMIVCVACRLRIHEVQDASVSVQVFWNCANDAVRRQWLGSRAASCSFGNLCASTVAIVNASPSLCAMVAPSRELRQDL